MRKSKRKYGFPLALRNFIRKYGPPIVFLCLIYVGIDAFHAFIDYLKRTWDIGAGITAVSLVFWLYVDFTLSRFS
ncbi:MAG: hypothetical protein HC768_22680 [Acaryochloris sp. CRU_2_0]|nr:hypothetical protein [Acaryochloris sp. CRU_2_0]